MASEVKTIMGGTAEITHAPTFAFRNVLIASGSLTWANSAPQYTAKTVDLTNLIDAIPGGLDSLMVVMYVPSSVTNVSGCGYVTKPINGSSRTILYSATSSGASYTTWSKSVAGSSVLPVHYNLLNVSGVTAYGITFRNDTVLGGSDGFTADYEIYV